MRLTLALIAALALALGWGLWQRASLANAAAQVASLQTDLAAAQAAREWAKEATAVHRAHLDRMMRQRAAYEAAGRDLQMMEGQDAPLSDLLGTAAGRLWP